MGFLDIALDRDRSEIYWTNNKPSENNTAWENAQSIFRSNLDGSHRENLVTVDHRDRGSNQAIALDPVGRKIFWTGWFQWHFSDWHRPRSYTMEIFRSSLDGSNVEQIHAVGYRSPLSSAHYPISDITLYTPHPTYVSTSGTPPAKPTASGLLSNYPNPFNASTLIPYKVATPGVVRLEIYNLQGQPVRTLVNEFRPTGAYHAQWDARDGQGRGVAAGIYFARLHYPEGGADATLAQS